QVVPPCRPSRRGVDRNRSRSGSAASVRMSPLAQGRGSKPPVILDPSSQLRSRPSRRGVDRNRVPLDKIDEVNKSPLAQGRGSKRIRPAGGKSARRSPLAQGRGSKPRGHGTSTGGP